jgi:hypothetical protein
MTSSGSGTVLKDPVILLKTVGIFSSWGCAAGASLSPTDEHESDEGQVVELSSSAISIMASPLNVSAESSVFVGEVGDWGSRFSLTRVSPVIARVGAIMKAGGSLRPARHERQQKATESNRKTELLGLNDVRNDQLTL